MGTGALLSELYVPHPGSLQQHQLWDLKLEMVVRYLRQPSLNDGPRVWGQGLGCRCMAVPRVLKETARQLRQFRHESS